MNKNASILWIVKLWGLLILFSACTPSRPTPQIVKKEMQQSPRIYSLYLPLIKRESITIWLSPSLPSTFSQKIALPSAYQVVETPVAKTLKIEIGQQAVISQWIYALVTPFASLVQEVSSADLLASWQGQTAGPFAGHPLLMDVNTHQVLTALWGESAPEAVAILDQNELLDFAWNHQPAWAIIPFEALQPRWKVLEVDHFSPLHRDFDSASYALSIPISLNGVSNAEGNSHSTPVLPGSVPETNRDPQKLTTLVMTGVTALVRATAYAMEVQGITYPAQDIGDWLRGADLTHISNEVPFAADCPAPNPVQENVRFCSRDQYLGLLEEVGADIIELSGDHFQDWGSAAVLHTLELYKERGWKYYGGGENLEDGRKALLIEDHGNHLAFIGCNAKGGKFAQASDSNPGAVPCDLDWMSAEIKRLRQAGYLPIATFQHQEYYTYAAQADQKADFRRMAEAGAVIVSGSQAHQPQTMDFWDGALVHYGLGNLFFDQYDLTPACRQGLLDRHIFYDGRYIGLELLPIQFVDYARSRPMTENERTSLLETLFAANGWRP